MSAISTSYGGYGSYNPYTNQYGYGSSNSMSSLYSLLSSTYGVNTAIKTMYQTASKVKSSGESVHAMMQSLLKTGSTSLFNQVGATSDNNKVATASVDGSKAKASELQSFEVNVLQIAKAQVNSGDAVKTENKAVSSGIHKFELKVGNISREISINVSASDNNDDIQRKMVSAINDAKLGVTASIDYDTKNKSQTLKLTAAATGNKSAAGNEVFTITDKVGSLALKMGVTQVSQEAQNAIYSVDGGVRQYSASNKIDMGNGVTLNLAGEGTAKFNFEKNGNSAVDKVKELVSAVNAAMASAAEGEGRGSMRLFNDLFQMTKAYAPTLARIGIEVSSGGVLTIDSDKLSEAAKNGSLEKMFQGDNPGFANRLERISNNMKSSNYYADQVNVNAPAQQQYYDKNAAISSLLDMSF